MDMDVTYHPIDPAWAEGGVPLARPCGAGPEPDALCPDK